VNTISFKFESDPDITEDVTVSGISGQLDVALNSINSLDQAATADTSSIKSELDRADRDTNKLPARYIIDDTTDNLFTTRFLIDETGYITINLTSMLSNSRLLKFVTKYKDSSVLSVTINIPKTTNYGSLTRNFKLPVKWKQGELGLTFDPYDYYDQADAIILQPIADQVTEFATLRRTYKTIEDAYLLIKNQFETQLVGEIDLEIDTAETYEPRNFKTVITRLLEFQVGTIQPALDYTKTAKLTTEYDRLTTMNTLIDVICKMYPDVTIEDGEGIPYDFGDRLEQDALN
jgi:hypothetical protein